MFVCIEAFLHTRGSAEVYADYTFHEKWLPSKEHLMVFMAFKAYPWLQFPGAPHNVQFLKQIYLITPELYSVLSSQLINKGNSFVYYESCI